MSVCGAVARRGWNSMCSATMTTFERALPSPSSQRSCLIAPDHAHAAALRQVLGAHGGELAPGGGLDERHFLDTLAVELVRAGAGHDQRADRRALRRVAQLGVAAQVAFEQNAVKVVEHGSPWPLRGPVGPRLRASGCHSFRGGAASVFWVVRNVVARANHHGRGGAVAMGDGRHAGRPPVAAGCGVCEPGGSRTRPAPSVAGACFTPAPGEPCEIVDFPALLRRQRARSFRVVGYPPPAAAAAFCAAWRSRGKCRRQQQQRHPAGGEGDQRHG